MESAKYFIMILILNLSIPAWAEGNWKSIIYKAYIGNNMNEWQKTIDRMEMDKRDTDDFLMQLINYQYGYIGWCIGNNRINQARKYLALAEKNLDELSACVSQSLVYSYISAFSGFKIGLNRLRAPVYGPRSIKYAQMAIEADPTNPLGHIQYGNSQYYMPPIFGGSKTEAIQYFQKAQELMEANGDQLKENWNYLSLLSLIAQAFEAVGDLEKARLCYERILLIEPDYSWVRDELHPQLIDKINQNQ